MKSIRDGFGDALAEYKDIIVLGADLAGATKTIKFKELNSHNYFECGISEANMIGVASGLSSCGHKVVISSFASFLTGRYDTIRCSIAMPKEPILMVGTHTGLSPSLDGATQSGIEDINVMNGLPNLTILQPATYDQAKILTDYALGLKAPVYLRIGRQETKEFSFDNYVNHQGFIYNPMREGKKYLILSSGGLLEVAVNVADYLDASLIDIWTLKPFNDNFTKSIISQYETVITIEDHSVIGGLGSIVANSIALQGLKVKLIKIGIEDVFPECGRSTDVMNKYGLNFHDIIGKINE